MPVWRRWRARRQEEIAKDILAAARADDADEAEAARQRVLDLARQQSADASVPAPSADRSTDQSTIGHQNVDSITDVLGEVPLPPYVTVQDEGFAVRASTVHEPEHGRSEAPVDALLAGQQTGVPGSGRTEVPE